MEISNVAKKENGHMTFQAKVSGEAWANALENASQSMQEKKPIPGYRVGKAPLGIAMKTFGSNLYETAANLVLNGQFNDAVSANGFLPVSRPKFSISVADSNEVIAECDFAAYPDISNLDLENITAEKPVKTCTEKELDGAVKRYLMKNPDADEKEVRIAQRKLLQDKYDADSERVYKKNVNDAIADRVDCVIPEEMIQVGLIKYINILKRFAQSHGIKPEEALSQNGGTIDSYINESRPHAVRDIKLSLAADYVIHKNNLIPSFEEAAKRIADYAVEQKIDAQTAEKRLGGWDKVTADLLNEMAMNIIHAKAVPIIKEVDKIPYVVDI